jgi:signal transduction histidine kinase
MNIERIKILIICENIEKMEFLKTIFQENRYEVLEAFNGIDGMQKTLDFFPNLIICEISLSDLDISHLITELCIYPETVNIPIVLLASTGDNAEFRKAMDSGADDYIPLPIDKNIILNSIKARLKKSKIGRDYSETEKKLFRQRISYMLPHEFNTPLMEILGGLEILSSSYNDMNDEERKEMIEISDSGAKRLSHMNKNYLQFIQLEMANYDNELLTNLKKGEIKEIEYIVNNISTEEATNYNRQQDLEINIHEGNYSVLISDGHFRTIVSEIVNNAFKFSKPGQKVEIKGVISDNKFLLTVKDYGYGMGIEEINKIGAYVQFGRIVNEQQGVGLGLSIAKRLTDIHEGELEVISEIDKGTTINIQFPIEKYDTT